jgi:hypothetical protein
MSRKIPTLICRAAFAAPVLLVACDVGDPSLDTASIGVFAGDGQSAPAGARLAIPLTVAVSRDDGAVAVRSRVRWSVIEGPGATVSDPATVTDPLGLAHVVLTLGPTPGKYRVRAVLASRADRAVAFEATATEPPRLTTVDPARFAGGDQITLTGQGLRPESHVFFDGVPAEVRSVSPGGEQLVVSVPRCLVPGDVPIHVVVQGAPTNQFTGTFTASTDPLVLDLGEHLSIAATALAACATFQSAGSEGREYLFVPQAATGHPGVEVPYRLTGNPAPTTATRRAPAAEPLPFAVQFHDRLRALGAELAEKPRQPLDSAVQRAPTAPVQVGHQRDFRVCNHVECRELQDFTLVSAQARYVGQQMALYVDEASPDGGFQDSDLASFGTLFDDHLHLVATSAFGVESDLDDNGVVIVLLSPVVNGLTPEPQCEQSVITGFFFEADIDPVLARDPRSNQGEVFYTLVPDADGTVSCAHPVDFVRRVAPVVFIHEFQHMISFYQHVLVRSGGSEQRWLNEGLSHLAEELGGLHFRNLGDQERFDQFVIANLIDAYQYLLAPSAEFLVPSEGRGTLAQRGAAWLFLRWLVDQHGENLPRRLVETRLTGAENIEEATAIPFHRLVAEWVLANYASDLSTIEPPPRLQYTDWRLRTTYRDLHEQNPQRFELPFPLVPQRFSAAGFDVTGTLRAGSGEYFLVVQDPSSGEFAVTFSAPDGDAIDPGAQPRLNVIRTR